MSNELVIRNMTRSEVNELVDWAAREGWNPGLHDDLPYWLAGTPAHLVIPYTLVNNDARYLLPNGFCSGEDFFRLLKDAFDLLWQEGAQRPASQREPIMTESKYFAAHTGFESEKERLTKLQRLFDPHTFEFLKDTGIEPGWRCLELGAGGGSVSNWLASRVGGSGKVVSLDLNLRFLTDLDADNIDVRQCDIRSDEVEVEHYDLVFTRLVLIHLCGDVSVMKKLVKSLKPGGWLVIEDLDIGTWRASEPDNRHVKEFDSTMATALRHDIESGALDPYFGGRLPGRLEDLGMTDIHTTCRLCLERGGSELSRFWHDTLAIDAHSLVDKGYLTKEQVDAWLQRMLDPGFYYYPPAIVSIRGRKPDGPDK